MKIFSLFALVLSTSVAAQDYVPPQPRQPVASRQPVAYNPTTTYTSSSFSATANFGGISITVPTYSTSEAGTAACKAAGVATVGIGITAGVCESTELNRKQQTQPTRNIQ